MISITPQQSLTPQQEPTTTESHPLEEEITPSEMSDEYQELFDKISNALSMDLDTTPLDPTIDDERNFSLSSTLEKQLLTHTSSFAKIICSIQNHQNSLKDFNEHFIKGTYPDKILTKFKAPPLFTELDENLPANLIQIGFVSEINKIILQIIETKNKLSLFMETILEDLLTRQHTSALLDISLELTPPALLTSENLRKSPIWKVFLDNVSHTVFIMKNKQDSDLKKKLAKKAAFAAKVAPAPLIINDITTIDERFLLLTQQINNLKAKNAKPAAQRAQAAGQGKAQKSKKSKKPRQNPKKGNNGRRNPKKD